MEKFAEDADLVAFLRDYLFRNGILESKVAKGKEEEGAKFKTAEFKEGIADSF